MANRRINDDVPLIGVLLSPGVRVVVDHEYLGAALAACTSMTLKMYAGRKAMKLDNALVTVDITRADDVESFSREIQLLGDLSAEDQERLLEIANKCPIHKALAGQIQIKTQLVN